MATAKKRYFPPASLAAISRAVKKRHSDKRRAFQMGVQGEVLEELKKRKCENVFYVPIPTEGQMDLETRTTAKLKNARNGSPNLALVIDGKSHLLLIKKENGRLSQAQRELREEIEAAGGVWAVTKGLDSALRQLEDWDALKPVGQIA